MELILCKVVESSCSPTRKIAPHTSSHDHEEIRKLTEYTSFFVRPAELRDSNMVL